MHGAKYFHKISSSFNRLIDKTFSFSRQLNMASKKVIIPIGRKMKNIQRLSSCMVTNLVVLLERYSVDRAMKHLIFKIMFKITKCTDRMATRKIK